jgi:hypothetical protein
MVSDVLVLDILLQPHFFPIGSKNVFERLFHMAVSVLGGVDNGLLAQDLQLCLDSGRPGNSVIKHFTAVS